MELGIEKCAMLIVKRETIERIEQSNQESIKILGEKEIYKNLRILEADTLKTKRDERRKKRKVYIRKSRKLLETKLCKNLKETNICAVSFVKKSKVGDHSRG